MSGHSSGPVLGGGPLTRIAHIARGDSGHGGSESLPGEEGATVRRSLVSRVALKRTPSNQENDVTAVSCGSSPDTVGEVQKPHQKSAKKSQFGSHCWVFRKYLFALV